MKTELQDLIEVITKDIEKSLNEIREIAKNANQSPTWDDAIQLSNLEKHISRTIKQYKNF
jgi:hypothetical protein